MTDPVPPPTPNEAEDIAVTNAMLQDIREQLSGVYKPEGQEIWIRHYLKKLLDDIDALKSGSFA